MRFVILCLICLLAIPISMLGQQEHLNRWDLFTGYSHLRTSSVNLNQNGFNGSFGANVNRWLALGTDFSIFKGSSDLTLRHTTLGPQVAQIVAQFPPAAQPAILQALSALKVPLDAKTFTWAVGPQFNFRKWDKITIFVRPGLGLIHERANLDLSGITALGLSPSLLPGLGSHLTDTVVFYGFGGGLDLNASRHIGFRVSADYVHSHLFADFLESRNTLRISVGPTWKWGEIGQ